MSLLALQDKIKRHIYKCFYRYTYKKPYNHLRKLHVADISNTINELVTTNKSISRFGDGEFRWLLNDNHDSFEKSSKLLSKNLYKVLINTNSNLMIGMPDAFTGLNQFTNIARKFWELFIAEYGNKIIPYLSTNVQYYNTGASRFYIDYNDKHRVKYYFKRLRTIWNSRNILIVEGQQSRLGVGDGFFDNANNIYRIECPSKNAFESYNIILNSVCTFLKNHKNYLSILSLGPTATILSYDLCNLGYRTLDLGHVDIEYDWYLMGAKKKENIKDKYVNEVKFGKMTVPVHNKRYMNQIVRIIH